MSYTPNKLATTSANGINSWNLTGGTGWSGDIWTGIGEQNDYTYAGVNLQTDQGGTLTFEFSQNGTDWTKYPVTEFTIVGGINEVHGAWKGTRYIRPKFTGNSGETRTYFRIRTMYSDVPIQLTAPLNQSIGADSDATITRAVGIGENPTGSYVNQKIDGIGFQTTDNLASGATFNSDIIDAQGYTQVQTHIVCDNDGTLGFKFCSTSDCTGTTPGQNGVERYLSVPYSSSGGFQLFSAPAFTPYVQYSFTNNGTGTTTQLFYETKLLTKALSGQLLGMDAFIAPSMVANLGRNVQVGKDPNGVFTNVKVDGTAFRTETPLSGTGVYTSPLVDTDGYSQIETHLYADVAGTLIGRWYNDENKTTLIRQFTRPYAGNEVSGVSYFSAPVFGPYLEYEYTNGSVAQSSFFLDFHPRTKGISGQVLGMNDFIPAGVVANLGRNVLVGQDLAGNFRNVGTDAEGHLKVHLDEPLTAFGELRTAEMSPLLQVLHPYELNLDLVSTGNTTGSGNVTYDSGTTMVSINSGAATSSSGIMSTRRLVKYRNGQGLMVRFTAIFDTAVTGNTQWVGWGDSSDGFFIGYSGTTFGVLRRNSNTGDVFTPQTEWNIDKMDGTSNTSNPTGDLLDPTKGNVYQMQVQWLGFGAINIGIESNQTGQFEPVHQVRYANSNTVPSVINPTFPLWIESTNTTNDTNVSIQNASLAAFNEGKIVYNGPVKAFENSVTTTAGGVIQFSLRNPTTYKGKVNRARIKLRSLNVYSDQANADPVVYKLILDHTITTPSWTSFGSYTAIETDIAGTYNTGGDDIFITGVSEVDSVTIDLTPYDIFLNPGETITLVGFGSNNGAGGSLTWVEDL